MAKVPNPRPNENNGHHIRGGSPVLLDSVKFSLICERYAETGTPRQACEDLGFNYNTVMGAIKSQYNRGDTSWQDLWDESYQKFRESLEKAIIQRGRDGTPTKFKVGEDGKPVPVEWTFSDRLLELAAKGHFPERYRDKIYAAGTVGLEPVDVFSNLTMKAKREIRAIIMRDLEEQRVARVAAEGSTLEGQFTEVTSDDILALGMDDEEDEG